MNKEINPNIDEQQTVIAEVSDDSLESASGGAGQNLYKCTGCGRQFATTHHPKCPYCGLKPKLF